MLLTLLTTISLNVKIAEQKRLIFKFGIQILTKYRNFKCFLPSIQKAHISKTHIRIHSFHTFQVHSMCRFGQSSQSLEQTTTTQIYKLFKTVTKHLQGSKSLGQMAGQTLLTAVSSCRGACTTLYRGAEPRSAHVCSHVADHILVQGVRVQEGPSCMVRAFQGGEVSAVPPQLKTDLRAGSPVCGMSPLGHSGAGTQVSHCAH